MTPFGTRVEREATGYAHPAYADALAEFGAPRLLPRSGAWILERTVPGTDDTDAMGCYPLFACRDWGRLAADLAELDDELVSLVVVPDPFGDHDLSYLEECFPDACKPFKEHFVADLEMSPLVFVHRHHLRYARNALRDVLVERCPEPLAYLDDWVNLYATLIERHTIQGLRRFSRGSFARQLAVPGIRAFRAASESGTVSMLLWYVQGDVAYYHLGASNAAGYELRASFALFWHAIEHFRAAGIRWLDLGAGAGVAEDPGGGLSRFKQGWSSGTRPAYICGRIFDRDRYEDLARRRAAVAAPGGDAYFPAYRDGEFDA
jgi:hypothetical protein